MVLEGFESKDVQGLKIYVTHVPVKDTLPSMSHCSSFRQRVRRLRFYMN